MWKMSIAKAIGWKEQHFLFVEKLFLQKHTMKGSSTNNRKLLTKTLILLFSCNPKLQKLLSVTSQFSDANKDHQRKNILHCQAVYLATSHVI